MPINLFRFRFVSEASEWGSSRGVCADWTVVNKGVVLKGVKMINSVDRVDEYAYYPSYLILHNRNVKMIGGKVCNYLLKL